MGSFKTEMIKFGGALSGLFNFSSNVAHNLSKTFQNFENIFTYILCTFDYTPIYISKNQNQDPYKRIITVQKIILLSLPSISVSSDYHWYANHTDCVIVLSKSLSSHTCIWMQSCTAFNILVLKYLLAFSCTELKVPQFL